MAVEAKDAKPAKDDKDAPPAGGTGMEKRDMKTLLIRSQREPVNCALAQGDSKTGSLGLMLLDKTKPPKTLSAELKKQFPGSKTPCFGTVSVVADGAAKVVTFSVNKKTSSLGKKLIKTLKGTGFKKLLLKTGGDDGDGGGADGDDE